MNVAEFMIVDESIGGTVREVVGNTKRDRVAWRHATLPLARLPYGETTVGKHLVNVVRRPLGLLPMGNQDGCLRSRAGSSRRKSAFVPAGRTYCLRFRHVYRLPETRFWRIGNSTM